MYNMRNEQGGVQMGEWDRGFTLLVIRYTAIVGPLTLLFIACFLWHRAKRLASVMLVVFLLSVFLVLAIPLWGVWLDPYVSHATTLMILGIFVVGNAANSGVGMPLSFLGSAGNSLALFANEFDIPALVSKGTFVEGRYTLMSYATSLNFLGDWIPGQFFDVVIRISPGDVLVILGSIITLAEAIFKSPQKA